MPRTLKTNSFVTVADLLHKLGNIPPRRIRMKPTPGTATEAHLIRLNDHTDRLYELVDGVLVEKAMGFAEGVLAADIVFVLKTYLAKQDLGLVAGADAPLRLIPGVVRLPDVTFVSWDQLPGHQVPPDPIAGLIPNLAVEVISRGNTVQEMKRKVREYFLAGTSLVWLVNPFKRIVEVYTPPEHHVILTEADTLDGGPVLPGFKLPLQQLFARLPKQQGASGKKKGKGKNGNKGG